MSPSLEAIQAALATVKDPEIHRPITDLGMVKSVDIGDDGDVKVAIYLTVAGCPMRDRITRDVTGAVTGVSGVRNVAVELDVMSEEQRQTMAAGLRGGTAEKQIPFAQAGSLTRVYAVASGKGGVGNTQRQSFIFTDTK